MGSLRMPPDSISRQKESQVMVQILWTAANLAAMAALAWITLRHKKKGELGYTIKASPPESEAGGSDLEPPMASRWRSIRCPDCNYHSVLDIQTGQLFDELTQTGRDVDPWAPGGFAYKLMKRAQQDPDNPIYSGYPTPFPSNEKESNDE